MKLDIEKLNSFLKISLVITNLFVVNLYLIVFSILSLGILTPALLGATYFEIDKIIQYDMIGLHKRFFSNIVKNFKYTMGKIFFISIFITVIFITMALFNELAFKSYNLVQLSIVLGAQIIMFFELSNILHISLIQIFILKNRDINKVLKNSFLILNTNVLKFLLANISVVISVALATRYQIFIVVFISLSLTLYYISIYKKIKEFYSNYC